MIYAILYAGGHRIKKKKFDFVFARGMAKKYAGKFAAIVNEKIIAVGKNRLEVFKKAEKVASSAEKIGVYYFPTKKEMLTAL